MPQLGGVITTVGDSGIYSILWWDYSLVLLDPCLERARTDLGSLSDHPVLLILGRHASRIGGTMLFIHFPPDPGYLCTQHAIVGERDRLMTRAAAGVAFVTHNICSWRGFKRGATQ